MHRRIVPLALLGMIVATLTVAGCSRHSEQYNQRKASIKQRAQEYQRAVDKVPAPKTVNFPLRQTLATMTERDDMLNHPWYIYILGMNGNVIGYYVAKSDPVNACDFLSSTQDETADHVIVDAPSLDGIFYGGSGSTAGCDAWVFLDYATNALIKIRGLAFYVADQPLRVDAQAIKVGK